MCVRNEMLRLPYFYAYYRRLGIHRFFIIDNGSTDGSREYLQLQEDTHVFSTSETFLRKEAWLDLLLRRYGLGQWCVVVDADEFLLYPHSARVSLPDLCRFLEQQGADVLHCFLLDLYPDQPLSRVHYEPGIDPLRVSCFFDPATHWKEKHRFRNCKGSLDFRYVGGVRHRVFGIQDMCCSKFPLFRFAPSMFLRDGQHELEGAVIADLQGVLMHQKFLHDFAPRVAEESVRGQHWNHASQYKVYAQKVVTDCDLCLMGPESTAYRDPSQLESLGLMRSCESFERFVAGLAG